MVKICISITYEIVIVKNAELGLSREHHEPKLVQQSMRPHGQHSMRNIRCIRRVDGIESGLKLGAQCKKSRPG